MRPVIATRVSLFLFDVDYFKTVDDAYGHSRGDEVLRQLAERITAAIRPHDELFRYGGDEFVVVLPETAFLTWVETATRGALPVTGQPGAGHTRFLAEVERIARLHLNA